MQRSGKELMQAQNAVSIEYFKNSKRFADLLNGYFFNGDEVVRWENVRERDPVLQKIKKRYKSYDKSKYCGFILQCGD